MAKMFVHYDGSVDNFKQISNYAKTYNNSIVFISGGVNDEGAAIYTHGKFYANIKDVQDLATSLADLKIIKGVKVGSDTKTAADHHGIIEFTSDSNSTVSVVGTSTGIQIGLNSAFVKRVTNAEGNITNVTNRVSAIEGTANDASSVNSIPGVKKYAEEKASAAQSAAADDATTKVGNAKSEIIGTSNDASKASTIYGAKKYADEKAAAAQTAAASDATTKANNAQAAAEATAADALSAAVNTINGEIAKKADASALETAVSNLNSAISTAKSGAISDAKTYTNEEIAKLSEVYDAFGSAAGALEDANDYTDAEIVKAKAYADGLAGNYDAKGSAAQALEDAKADAANKYQVKGNYEESGAAANALQEAKNFATGLDTEMDKRVKVLEGIDHDQLAADAASSAVATILDGAPEKFNTLKEVADWIANSESADSAADLVTRVAALEGIDHDAYVGADEANLAAAKKYTDDEIAELDLANTYDAKGAAASAETAAKSYTDTKIGELSFDAAGTAASEAASALAEAKSYVDGKVDGKFDAAGTAAGLNSAMDARVKILEGQDVFVEEDVNNAIATAEQNAKNYANSLAGNYEVAGAAAIVQGNLDSEVSRAKQAEGDLSKAISDEATTRESEDTRILGEAKSHTNTEVGKVNTRIDNLDFATKAEDGFYVTSITQTDGQVSATMGKAIAAEKITISDSADHFPVTVTNVEQALAFMADMLTWEEL